MILKVETKESDDLSELESQSPDLKLRNPGLLTNDSTFNLRTTRSDFRILDLYLSV